MKSKKLLKKSKKADNNTWLMASGHTWLPKGKKSKRFKKINILTKEEFYKKYEILN